MRASGLARATFAYFLVLVSLSFASAIEDWTTRDNFAGNLNADGITINGTLEEETSGLRVLANNWDIKYQRCLIYALTVTENTTFELCVLSEAEKLGMSLVDTNLNVITVGEEDPNRKYRRLIRTSLVKSQQYWVLIGSGTSDQQIDFSVAARIVGQTKLPDPTLPVGDKVQLGTSKHLLGRRAHAFEGKQARFFNIEPLYEGTCWLTIHAKSDKIDPVVHVLDAYNRVIAFNDDIASGTNEAKVVLKPKDTCKILVVSDYKTSVGDKSEGSANTFQITIKRTAYNPQGGIVPILRHGISDPLVTFILGLVASGVLGWYFYRRGLLTRRIEYKTVTDHLIIAEPEESTLKLRLGDEEFKCASLFKIRLTNSGQKRISKELVKEKLRVVIGNIQKIIKLTHACKGEGWLPPQLVNTVTFLVDFNHIDPNDWLEVSAVCQQDINVDDLSISPQIKGSVAETRISEDAERVSEVLLYMLSLVGLLFIFVGPLLLVDVKFSFMPDWWYKIVLVVWMVFVVLATYFYFGTRRGRQMQRSLFRAIWRKAKGVFR